MLRVVNLRKAALAGAAGALCWEGANRFLAPFGAPVFDVVRVLGTLAFATDQPLGWWSIGLTAHILVGICWATFYAYFFWARFDWPLPVQGVVFAALPAILAATLVHRQFQLMHLDVEQIRLTWGSLAPQVSHSELLGLVWGHVLYGSALGLIYQRPVGFPAADRPPSMRRAHPLRSPRPSAREQHSGFMFATGIECSYPTIEHGRWRRDQMAATGHYDLWQRDFELCREVGVTHLRYGPPLHLVFTGPGQYDWSCTDEPLAELQAVGPEPIIDLCHFGLPTWLGDFQNPDVPAMVAEYAQAFAGRYPWVRFYTPVNEMYVCARFSALDGIWNEQAHDERSFLIAAFHLAEASSAMSSAILSVQPEAVFINSESSEFNQPCCPDPRIRQIAAFENERRFLPLDLIYQHEVSPAMLDHIRCHGLQTHLGRFAARQVPKRSILGLDYYEWNERLIDRDGRPQALGELFGWYVIASQYFARYGRPMMHTETNRLDAADGPRWLWRQWHNVQLLRQSGVPLVGFTWYSLTDQIDWEHALARPLGRVDPVGLFDLNRDPRDVGLSYAHLINIHRDLPEFRECAALRKVLS